MKPHLRITHTGKVVKVAVPKDGEEPNLTLNEPKQSNGGKLPNAVIVTSKGVRRAWDGTPRESGDDTEPKEKSGQKGKK